MDQLTAMRAFRRVVELESFAATARDLGYSNAAISKNISELEAHLGARLLTRTTRRMSVTEIGHSYYRRCVAILDELEDADREAAQLGSTPRGVLRISAPMSFGLLHLSSALPEFLKLYPEIDIDLVLNDRHIDLIEEGIDVAFRAGGALPDSSLVVRRIMPVNRLVCGSPDYFDEHGVPETPEDLKAHQCLIYSLSASPREWRFDGSGGARSIKVAGRFSANSSISLREALLAGLGLTLIPTFIVAEDIRQDRLRPVLTEWSPAPQAAYAVYVNRQYVPLKIRCFVDFLVKTYGSKPGWD